MKLALKQEPLGTNMPEKDMILKLFNDMSSIYESVSKRCNEEDEEDEERKRAFHKVLVYLMCFQGYDSEKERNWFMDKMMDSIIECGKAWFSNLVKFPDDFVEKDLNPYLNNFD